MATKKTTLDDLSIEQLEKRLQDLDTEKQDIRQEQLDVHAVLDRKNAELDAARRYDQMSSPERAALAQYIKTHGIETIEKVGTPGGDDEE